MVFVNVRVSNIQENTYRPEYIEDLFSNKSTAAWYESRTMILVPAASTCSTSVSSQIFIICLFSSIHIFVTYWVPDSIYDTFPIPEFEAWQIGSPPKEVASGQGEGGGRSCAIWQASQHRDTGLWQTRTRQGHQSWSTCAARDGETPQTKELRSSIIYSLSGDLNKSEQTNLAGELTAFDTLGLDNWALTPTPPRQGLQFSERDVANNYFRLICACVTKIAFPM